MSEDYSSASNLSGLCEVQLLKELNSLLNQYGKSIDDYDLPAININEDVDIPQLIEDEKSIPISDEDLSSNEKLNVNQKCAFNLITEAVINGESKAFFVDGPGGTGKTFLYRCILSFLRHRGYIVLATASSGIASIMMSGGRTAHSRFKISVKLCSTSSCMISIQSDEAKLLHLSSAIIWDEATITHRYAFEALNKTMKDIIGNELPFGGKVVVLGGDFQQILPVVQYGTKAQTIDACIANSGIWNDVIVIRMIENMRAKEDSDFSNFLLRIGDGNEAYVESEMIRMPEDMVVPWEGEKSLFNFIDIIFPSLSLNAHDKKYITKRALLTLTNQSVDQINNDIISLFHGDEQVYFSFDAVENDRQNLYQQEYLNSVMPGGLSPHKLTLKIGAPIMLLRNIGPRIGLCNGTRLICKNFSPNLIDAEIVISHCYGTRVFIHRIPLQPLENVRMPFTLIRKQFLLRLSFALTINKSQGQAIPYVGVYLPDHVFSHGQLYIALSRGVSRSTRKLLIKNGHLARRQGIYTKNVVYKDVLVKCHGTSN